jgi:SAM-dependent methyltransferase
MITRIPYAGCPLCNATQSKELRVADCSKYPFYDHALSPHMTWMHCTACHHVYVDGIYTEEALGLLLSRTHPSQAVGHDYETQRFVTARMIEKVLPYAHSGRWLDIGFGSGALLLTAQEFGFTPVGIDLRVEVVNTIRQLGVEAHAVELTQFAATGPFDVISICDTLEHMPYPVKSLAAVHRLLADDGVLFLSMPNSGSVIWQLLDQANANPYWGEMEHYHNFSRARLYRLLDECGFEAVRYGVSERYRACMEVVARKKR